MRIALSLICLCLTACGPPDPIAAPANQTPEKEQHTQMRDSIQAPIEKAKKVEDQVIDGAEKQLAEIEAAGG